MGVEPTKDRLAALPGFEVRTPHRGRCSSNHRCRAGFISADATKQIETVLVDTPQVAAADRNTVPVEKLQYLNRNFAAIVQPVAKLRGIETAVLYLRRNVAAYLHHLGDGTAQEKVVMRHFIHFTHPR